MDEDEKVNYWIKGADENFSAAKTLLGGGHFLECGFFCHLTVEKALKAVISKTGATPLPIHSLPKLAEMGGIYGKMTEEQLLIIEAVNPLNIEGRYPDYKKRLAAILTKERCEKFINDVEGLLCWIKAQL